MTTLDILQKSGLNMKDLKEYSRLKKSLFGTGLFKSLFVIVDENSPDVKRYNELAGKVMKLQAYLVSNRSTAPIELINGVIQ